MKRIVIGGISGGAILVAAAVFLALRQSGSTENASATEAADSATAALLAPSDLAQSGIADLVDGVPVSGTLKPVVDIRIASPMPEVMEEVTVREGQAVRRGDVLGRLRAGALEPAAASAELQRRKAASDYTRMQNLFREGAVAQSDVETAEVALRAAEAAESRARKQFDETIVRASVDGVIAERHVDAGDRVKDGDPLFRLVNTSRLEFEATVPSEFAGRIRPGAAVALQVTGASDTSRTVPGSIARVSPTVDAATRQLKVYVAVPNGSGRLVGGQFASGHVVLRRVAGAIAVPETAVRRDSAGAYVLAVEHGRLARHAVTAGITDDRTSLTQITVGLPAGSTVVIGPANGLRAGQAVSLRTGN